MLTTIRLSRISDYLYRSYNYRSCMVWRILERMFVSYKISVLGELVLISVIVWWQSIMFISARGLIYWGVAYKKYIIVCFSWLCFGGSPLSQCYKGANGTCRKILEFDCVQCSVRPIISDVCLLVWKDIRHKSRLIYVTRFLSTQTFCPTMKSSHKK